MVLLRLTDRGTTGWICNRKIYIEISISVWGQSIGTSISHTHNEYSKSQTMFFINSSISLPNSTIDIKFPKKYMTR